MTLSRIAKFLSLQILFVLPFIGPITQAGQNQDSVLFDVMTSADGDVTGAKQSALNLFLVIRWWMDGWMREFDIFFD